MNKSANIVDYNVLTFDNSRFFPKIFLLSPVSENTGLWFCMSKSIDPLEIELCFIEIAILQSKLYEENRNNTYIINLIVEKESKPGYPPWQRQFELNQGYFGRGLGVGVQIYKYPTHPFLHF